VCYGAIWYERILSLDEIWMAGSRGGNVILPLTHQLLGGLSALWQSSGVCLVLIWLPLLCGQLLMGKRLLYKFVIVLCILLGLHSLLIIGTTGAFLVGLAVLMAFWLLYASKNLAWSILAIPFVACGCVWLYAWYATPLQEMLSAFITIQESRVPVWEGIARLLQDAPAGIGLSPDAMAGLLPSYMEMGDVNFVTHIPTYADVSLFGQVAMSLGIPGLILLVLTGFLFLQKSLTCLRISGDRRDKVMVLSGTLGCMGLFLYGVGSSLPCGMPVCFALAILLGLCNAYENLVLQKCYELSAVEEPTPHQVDAVYRV